MAFKNSSKYIYNGDSDLALKKFKALQELQICKGAATSLRVPLHITLCTTITYWDIVNRFIV